MKTHEFLSLLENHKDKSLLFEYTSGKYVAPNYHITEVKHVSIDSVDCGSGIDSWNETIVQLWESPSEKNKKEYMSTFKALGILKKVGQMKPFDFDAEIKFEYSNATFHTAQLFVDDFEIFEKQLRLKLAIQKTDCKAKEACGISEPKLETAEACCSPGSGCC
ncbi:MAG: DUF6428 family protein [Flavobacteriaceae bacterium]|nr:hypothetical protein [Flavobacteriaceae bacterium]